MTPIKVGDTVYLCTPHNIVMALDPVSGREKWRFDPHVRVDGTQHMSCRGVAYYDAAAGNAGAPAAAAKPSARLRRRRIACSAFSSPPTMRA